MSRRLYRRPLDLALWEQELEGDPDRLYIWEGLQHGFRIVSNQTEPLHAVVPNYRSALNPATRSLVEKQIANEILHGNYRIPVQPPMIISALGAVPKPGLNRIRLIHDCSRPEGLAVNDYAGDYKFRYQSLDDAVAQVRPGCFMAKVDLRSAYRSIPVHPDCYRFFGLAVAVFRRAAGISVS